MDGTTTTSVFDYIGIPIDYAVLGLLGLMVILILLLVIQQFKIAKLKKKYRSFMSGQDGMSLEDAIVDRFQEIDHVKEVINQNSKLIRNLQEEVKFSFSKFGIVKYDAFKEMGGKLSFSIALVNDENNGFILNSMHSREGCYTYVKEVVKGESYIVLADEEKEALTAAINMRNFLE